MSELTFTQMLCKQSCHCWNSCTKSRGSLGSLVLHGEYHSSTVSFSRQYIIWNIYQCFGESAMYIWAFGLNYIHQREGCKLAGFASFIKTKRKRNTNQKPSSRLVESTGSQPSWMGQSFDRHFKRLWGEGEETFCLCYSDQISVTPFLLSSPEKSPALGLTLRVGDQAL